MKSVSASVKPSALHASRLLVILALPPEVAAGAGPPPLGLSLLVAFFQFPPHLAGDAQGLLQRLHAVVIHDITELALDFLGFLGRHQLGQHAADRETPL